MTGNLVARRYAKALVALMRENEDLDGVLQKLKEFGAVIEENRSLQSFLYGRTFGESMKQNVAAQIMERLDFPPVLRNFVALLVKRDRLRFLSLIEDCFSRYVDESQNRLRVEAVAAADLSAAEVDRLTEGLASRTGKTILLRVRQDPDLIGGLKIRVGSTVLDGSLRAQFAALKDDLIRG